MRLRSGTRADRAIAQILAVTDYSKPGRLCGKTASAAISIAQRRAHTVLCAGKGDAVDALEQQRAVVRVLCARDLVQLDCSDARGRDKVRACAQIHQAAQAVCRDGHLGSDPLNQRNFQPVMLEHGKRLLPAHLHPLKRIALLVTGQEKMQVGQLDLSAVCEGGAGIAKMCSAQSDSKHKPP